MTQCIPRAVGVPGLIFQPPTWPGIEGQTGDAAWPTTAPPSASVPRGLDDPRWQGSHRIGHPAAMSGGETMTFRCVYHDEGGQKSLFLSWHVRADASPDPDEDILWVGFERASGPPLLVYVEPFSSGAAKVSGTVATAAAFAYDGPDNTATALADVPDWIDANTRAWFDPGSNRWAVQMRVPVNAADANAGVNLGATFRMWYEVTVAGPPATPGGPKTAVMHRWPYNAAVVTEAGFPPKNHFPPLSTWDTFHLSTGAGDPVCPNTGFVALSSADVGTTNTPTSKIVLSAPNTFEAKPENKTGSAIPAGSVSALFRIANWGSIADPAAPWDQVQTSGGSSNPATNAASIPNAAKGSITLQSIAYDPNDFEPVGPKSRHQCILVELSGAGLTFQPSSVWRNMDFGTASRFERMAELNSKGLGNLPGGEPERDTFLLVEKLNMPGEDDGHAPPPKTPKSQEPQQPQDAEIRRAAGVREGDAAAALAAAGPSATATERLDANNPTYRVHVLYDSGLTAVRKGKTLRVLTPGTSFGYYLDHDGATPVWSDDVVGATRIAPRFYRLSVPVEGVARITNVIEARDAAGGGFWAWLLRLLRKLWRALRKLFGG